MKKNLARELTFQLKMTAIQLTQTEEKKEPTGLYNWQVRNWGWFEAKKDPGTQKCPWGSRSARVHYAGRPFFCGSQDTHQQPQTPSGPSPAVLMDRELSSLNVNTAIPENTVTGYS